MKAIAIIGPAFDHRSQRVTVNIIKLIILTSFCARQTTVNASQCIDTTFRHVMTNRMGKSPISQRGAIAGHPVKESLTHILGNGLGHPVQNS